MVLWLPESDADMVELRTLQAMLLTKAFQALHVFVLPAVVSHHGWPVVFGPVQVRKHDFLEALKEWLGEVVAHPLGWQGDRPKGLAVYESAAGKCQVNGRASGLRGLDIHGDAVFMEASAHQEGARLVDVTLARYEALKAERQGRLSHAACALNCSRGMLWLGHPELPEAYAPDTWLGMNAKTLLMEVARRRGCEPPIVEVGPYGEEGQFRASASVKEEELWAYGDVSSKKMDAQHSAALNVMRMLKGLGLTKPLNKHPGEDEPPALLEELVNCLRQGLPAFKSACS